LCVPIADTINEENDIEQSIEDFILTYKEDVNIYTTNKIKQFKERFFICRASIEDYEHLSIIVLWK